MAAGYLHRNLQVVIFNMLLSTYIVIFSQQILILGMHNCIGVECYDNPDGFLTTHLPVEFIKFIAEVNYLTSASCVLIERASATITMTKYENTGMMPFVFLDVCHWILSATLGYCIINFQMSFLLFFCMTFFIVFPAIGYYIIVWINQRRYTKSTTIGTNYTLSERYMLSQNIKTARLLHYIIITAIFCNFYACIHFYMTRCIEDLRTKYICKLIFDISLSMYTIFFPLLILYVDKSWRSKLRSCKSRLYLLHFNSISPSANSNMMYQWDSDRLRRSDGAQMIFKVDIQQQIYFQQLQKAWN